MVDRSTKKRWSALAIYGAIAAQMCDVFFEGQSGLTFADVDVIRKRSQKKRLLIARQRNQVQG
jgi:hypothetical protein